MPEKGCLMSIFKLTPNLNHLSDPAWQGSANKKVCHVSAKSEADARQYAAEKFQVGGQVTTSNPWLNDALTDCLVQDIAASEPLPLGEIIVLE